MKIKKGDKVQMISGKDRGKTGAVTLVRLDKLGRFRLVVEGLNKIKKHQRARSQGQKGQIVSIERAVSASSVQLVCGSCGKITRVGYRREGDQKLRICKKCKATIN